ncbi:MAG: choice-of-anchor Q domain-containing protein [Kiritimatiellae bacterium]|nr:choice-of-anchor Q domain-containing protein [Kiritimatiellia bacterium]
MRLTTGLVLAAGIWCADLASAAATRHVAPPPAGSDANGGTGWGDAWATIGHAVAQSDAGDLILVSTGVYAITTRIAMEEGVTIRGFSGNPADTIVNAGGADLQCFFLSNTAARVESLTASNGTYGFYLEIGGTVSNCVSTGHKASNQASGAFIRQGLVENCLLAGNVAYFNGGGATLVLGGNLRNCLIVDNVNTRMDNGGGIHFGSSSSAGIVENCTITRNTAIRGGGINKAGSGTVRNSIIYGNRAPTDADAFGGGYNNCIIGSVPPSGSNKNDDPRFVSSAAGDFRLLPGSPAINTGANQTWMEGAVDFAGNPRTNGVVDMGCYEYTPGALQGGFGVSPSATFPGSNVILSAAVAGTNTADTTYAWDFDGDGSFTVTGADKAVVTNVYPNCGRYTVTLRVSNGAGETNLLTRAKAVAIGPVTSYVARSGNTPQFPYDTLSTAASNVQDAVDAAVNGSTVLVGGGRYILDKAVAVSNAVAIRSTGGKDAAILDGNGVVNVLYLDHALASVDGFTITNGRSASYVAAGVHMYNGGTVRNCTLVGNTNVANYGAGGFYIEGLNGTLSHCSVVLNAGTASYGVGGGGVLVRGTVRNCLVAGNHAAGGSGTAGGIKLPYGGLIESCTIVGNYTANGAGGIRWDGNNATILYNNIIVSNYNGATVLDWSENGSEIVNNNCTPVTLGTACITNDPAFRNPGSGSGLTLSFGDYRLKSDSPCRDQGFSRTWHAGALDLAGAPRVVYAAVDIGVYEVQLPKGTTIILR